GAEEVGTMAMNISERNVRVRFDGDATGMNRAAARAQRALERFRSQALATQLAFSKSFGLMSAAAVALPSAIVAGAGAAALAVGALPLAVAGAGALIISKNEEIKKSFEGMGTAINDALVKATKPLEETFRNLAEQTQRFVNENQGALTDLFAAAAP